MLCDILRFSFLLVILLFLTVQAPTAFTLLCPFATFWAYGKTTFNLRRFKAFSPHSTIECLPHFEEDLSIDCSCFGHFSVLHEFLFDRLQLFHPFSEFV